MEEKTKKTKKVLTIFKGKNLVILILSILVVALLIALAYSNGIVFNARAKNVVSSAIKSLNDNFLKSKGVKAELSGKVTERSGVYQFSIKINGQEYPSYLTKDGALLFPDAIKLVQETKAEKEKAACAKIKKSESPKMEAFVVSYCPFGLQMERMISDMVKENPIMAKYVKIKYIGSEKDGKITSMHGDKEAAENLRQICIREEQPNKYFSYISCFIKDGKSEECLNESKVNKAKLEKCEKAPKRGLAYAKKDFDEADKYGVSGSPTLIMNGEKVSEFDFGGRTAEAVQKLICCSAGNKPEACSKKINNSQAARGFSKTYSGGSSSKGGSCN